MYKYKNEDAHSEDTQNKYVIEDEKSFNAFINYQKKNQQKNNQQKNNQHSIYPNCEVVFYAFDGPAIEKKLFFYLKALEHLAKFPASKLEIRSDSALILIALPILKKISNLVKIELTAVRGFRPEEIIKAAKTIREHGMQVKVRYLKQLA